MHQFSLRFLATAALVTSAIACDHSPTGPGQLAVAVNVARTSIRAGDSVTVQVTVTNVGAGTVTYNPSACARLFEVRRQDQVVVSTTAPCAATTAMIAFLPRALKAGQSETITYVWRAQFDGFPALLTPGSYVLRGNVNSGSGAVQSAAIAIEILSRQ